MAGNLEGARNVFSRLGLSLQSLGEAFDPMVRGVEIHSCVDHPEVAETDPAQACSDCGKRLHPRRFPYSAIYAAAGQPLLRLELKTSSPLESGRKAELLLRLTTVDGRPATEADLVLTHSGRVHLLLIDETGDDFHHLVPRPGNEAGVYEADFIPSQSCDYAGWVEVIPAATRLPESLPFHLPGREQWKGEGPLQGVGESLSVEIDGVQARMVLSGPGPARLRARKTQLVQVHLSESDGRPVTRLEPLWNSFAHLTLVSENLDSALQVHPLGGELLSEDLRSGPTLAFKLHPPAPGMWRIFCQVRINGETRTFPLAVTVNP